MSGDLKFHKHICSIVVSAHQKACHIFRSFVTRDRNFLVGMFKCYVIPKLEFSSVIWNPYQRTDIKKLESVQRRFTKRIPGLRQICYQERLKKLSLSTLERRRLELDLCMVYRIVYGLCDLKFSQFF